MESASPASTPASTEQYRQAVGLSDRAVRVLVVDDWPDNAESMAMLLRLHGHEVEVALNGPAALRLAWLKRPDVALLDISMPGMSGYAVARWLREMFPDGPPFLVAITAHGLEEGRSRCREAGFNLHLVKPADPCQVAALLQGVTCST